MTEEAYVDDFDDRGIEDDETPGAGCYHVVISDVDETGGKESDQLVVSCVVLSPGVYKGLTHKTYIPMNYTEWPRKRRYKLAVVCGLTTWKLLKAGGVTLDWQDLLGKEFVIHLTEEEYKGKTYVKAPWPNNFISLDSAATIKKLGCILDGDKAPETKGKGKVSSETLKADPPVKEVSDNEVPF